MAREYRAHVQAMWAARIRARKNLDALTLAYFIADTLPADGTRVWFAGRTTVAVALGLIDPGDPMSDSAKRMVARAVAVLVEVGFLKRVGPGFHGRNAEFTVALDGPRLPVETVDNS